MRALFGATILALEAFVVFFATVTAARLDRDRSMLMWIAGIGACLVLLALAAAARLRAVQWIGLAAQATLIAGGLIVPMLYALGALFAVLYIIGLVLGTRIDQDRASGIGADPPPESAAPAART